MRDNKTFQKYRPPKYDFYNKQVIIEPRFWQIQSYNLIKGNLMLESSRFLQSIFCGIIFNFFNFIKKKIWIKWCILTLCKITIEFIILCYLYLGDHAEILPYFYTRALTIFFPKSLKVSEIRLILSSEDSYS